jgi:hypothetical protein
MATSFQTPQCTIKIIHVPVLEITAGETRRDYVVWKNKT